MPISLYLLTPPPPPPPFFHGRTAVASPNLRPSSAISPPRLRRKAAARCGSQGGSWEREEWVKKLGRVEEEEEGVVEMLECLEREAIMGEDQGRDPNDYNRRAKIFTTSSAVFQALKQQQHEQDTHQKQEG